MLNEAITEYQRVLAKYPAIPLPGTGSPWLRKQGRIQEAANNTGASRRVETADSNAPEFAAADDA